MPRSLVRRPRLSVRPKAGLAERDRLLGLDAQERLEDAWSEIQAWLAAQRGPSAARVSDDLFRAFKKIHDLGVEMVRGRR